MVEKLNELITSLVAGGDKGMTAKLIVTLLVVALLCFSFTLLAQENLSQNQSSEKIVAFMDSSWLDVAFSPDGKRIAYLSQAGKKQLVVVDGKEGKQYEAVGDSYFQSRWQTLGLRY